MLDIGDTKILPVEDLTALHRERFEPITITPAMIAYAKSLLAWLDSLTSGKRLQRVTESDSLLSFLLVLSLFGDDDYRDDSDELHRFLCQLTQHYWKLLMSVLPQIDDRDQHSASRLRLGLSMLEKNIRRSGQMLNLEINSETFDAGGFMDSFGRCQEEPDIQDQMEGFLGALDSFFVEEQDETIH